MGPPDSLMTTAAQWIRSHATRPREDRGQLTFCARSKIMELLRLAEKEVFRISFVGNPIEGSHVGFSYETGTRLFDVRISETPPVVVDGTTYLSLNGQIVDFSYPSEEFIITSKKAYDVS